MRGFAEAVPEQAEIFPVATVAMMVSIDGFTVIVNVVGAPVQPIPPVTKLPNEVGNEPTPTVAIIVLVAVLITETLLEPGFATYTRLPSGLHDMPDGPKPCLLYTSDAADDL